MSIDFPLLNETQTKLAGDWDAYVTKLNAFGSALVLSTYLGGKGMDEGFGIAEDDSGNIFVAGWTDSNNFPLADPIQNEFRGGRADAFVTELKINNHP